MAPVRLAVLECGEFAPKAMKKYGGYHGAYTALLHKAADNLSIPHDCLDISKYDVVNEIEKYPSIDDIDAIIISGSST